MRGDFLAAVLGGLTGAGQGIAQQQAFRSQQDQLRAKQAQDEYERQRQAQNDALDNQYKQAQITALTAKPAAGWEYDRERGALVNKDTGEVRQLTGLPPKVATNPVKWDQFENSDGSLWERNPETGATRPVTLPSGTQAKGYHAPQSDVMAEQKKYQREQGLSQEYQKNPLVQQAYGVAAAAGQIRGLAQKVDNPQGDLDIIYQVVKLRDPQSAVREGEIDLQRAARSVGTQVTAAWQKAKTGRMLTPQERQQIVGLLDTKEQASAQNIAPVQKIYGQRARQFQADSAFVAPSPFSGSGGIVGSGGAVPGDKPTLSKVEFAKMLKAGFSAADLNAKYTITP